MILVVGALTLCRIEFTKYQECLYVAIWSCWDRFGAYISWGKILVNTNFVFIFTEFLIFEYLRS